MRASARYIVPTSGTGVVAARFDVLDDAVAVPLAGGEAEQDVKLDRANRQECVDAPFVSIHTPCPP